MFGSFTRSWEITKLSFNVISKDKEIILFPVLAAIFSFIYIVLLAVPSLLPAILSNTGMESVSEALMFIVMFFIYLGLAFIATFFNVCVVYTTKVRFEGGNATFGESLRFAFSKIHLIFMWSIVSATVGLLLRVLDNIAEKVGGIGEFIIKAIVSLIGFAWGIISIFVVPGMVYEDLGPFEALKKSIDVIKKTWGENLIKHYGLGLIQFLVLLAGIIVLIPLAIVSAVIPFGLVIVITLAIVYIVVVSLVFSVAKSIFNTALYVYASTGSIPSGYNAEIMQNAFIIKKK